MKKIGPETEKLRCKEKEMYFYKCIGDEENGIFEVDVENRKFMCIISKDKDWEHLSISTKNRCPNWKEMCIIKDMFFEDEETCIQFHPKKSEYVNNAENCLHIWRSVKEEVKLPDPILVGIKQ